MKEEAKLILKENLKLPEKIMIYEERNGIRKSRIVKLDVDHFIEWIDKRVSFTNIWDYTLRMIEGCVSTYSKDKKVIEYYIKNKR